ncbi:glycoside hydrolase family 2 protein [Nonomuraea sp. MG754425]|uniref:glycoside hydrolase family 2 protein n=1 Tax=Nonomuraea sp. MG754425 TaxID=2570319 RepID=UPI001F1CFAD1|nr:glycoside hydrolase family 2 protein [Nonomuraea sp. MG754425]MCF6468509.1 glycoside hydrolase family 2 protein [Nonomuraea sp. MG754425]
MTTARVTRTPLAAGWTAEAGAAGRIPPHVRAYGPIPATVPGTVHTDLLAAGLIDDPYLDDNERTQGWIGAADWTYRRELRWEPDGSERQELLFHGIDTVSVIRLNGAVLGTTRNMHRSHRFDVTGLLNDGANDLAVEFTSAIRAADAAGVELGYRPHTNHHPYNAIRKMACAFGWDWGIDTSTCGLWRPVVLETWSVAAISELRAAGVVRAGIPTAVVDVTIRRTDDRDLALHVTVAGRSTVHSLAGDQSHATIEIAAPDAALWWPRGHGQAALHDLRVELLHAGTVLDGQSRRIGFRTVELHTEPDENGTPFRIAINGQNVLIRGANWIPDDAFPHRVDRPRYARRLDQAEFAGINLLRVWGGGIYELDDFYAECDARGILTWQDFLFACAAYAEEEPLWSEIEAEAREAVTRLGSHPSLVLLNGNNENLWGHQEWGWTSGLDGQTWGERYYYDLLPGIVNELAPHVAYTPGSPYNPARGDRQNDPAHGTVHIWDVWNEKDYQHYRDYRPRFVSEFGWQGPPTWSTLTQSISDDPLTPESPGMLVHQKAARGNTKLTNGLLRHLPLPRDMRDWHWAMSLNQAVAVRTGIEWFRSLTPLCTGTIVWQLNDCWPVTSWAAVDGYGRRKPMLFALRHAHAERLLTMQPDDGDLTVTAVNDTARPWSGTLTLDRRRYDGTVLTSERTPLEIPPRGSATHVASPALATPGDAAGELLVATFSGARAHWFFTEYRESGLEAPKAQVTAARTPDGWAVTILAANLLRDVVLFADLLDPEAVVEDGLVTLLPGETVTIRVRGAVDAGPGDFAGAPVLRSANDLLVTES